MLLEAATHEDVDLTPFLKLYVGLEISACTSHTRHETLWESLGLANKVHSTCRHEAGSLDCLGICWKSGPQDSRAKLKIALQNLAATGTSKTGSLIAFWPFTETPAVYHMEPGTVISWFRSSETRLHCNIRCSEQSVPAGQTKREIHGRVLNSIWWPRDHRIVDTGNAGS